MPAAFELIQLLGEPTVVALQAALGPTHIHVPVKPDPEHPIAQAIGMPAMRLLCEEHGGLCMYIGVRHARRRFYEQMVSEGLNGLGHVAMAKRYGITARWAKGRYFAGIYGSAGRIRRFRSRTGADNSIAGEPRHVGRRQRHRQRISG